jgi:hypothetical protein
MRVLTAAAAVVVEMGLAAVVVEMGLAAVAWVSKCVGG